MKHHGEHQPANAAEQEFADIMRTYHRRAGNGAACALLDRMREASADGAYRQELSRMAAAALPKLPSVH